jgi:hypothetical protein
MRKVPLEQLRVYLMRARAAPAAIGLPPETPSSL